MTRPPYQGGGLARLVTGDFGFFDFGNVWDAGSMMMVIMMMGAKVSASPPPRVGGCFDFDPISSSPQSLWRRVASLSGGEWRVASGEWGEWPGRVVSGDSDWRVASHGAAPSAAPSQASVSGQELVASG